jgi:2-(1,2-epoxy-1,2-dihydrophenyl)acetyl-CoA isomerase
MVRLTFEDGLARIVLARSAQHNALDLELAEQLARVVAACVERPDVRAVLISAEGPAFTVGGDLEYLGARSEPLADALERMITRYHEALLGLAELPVPVVCAAHGAVAGGGLGLLWCSDVVLLSEDARLASGFARLGLPGDGGSSWYLPRLIGLRRATELILEGRVLSAREAVDWGLASRTVAPDRLESEALAATLGLAAGPTRAYGEIRRLIRGAFDRELAATLDAERAAMLRCGAGADALEGIASFVERRAPRFQGT